jgi:hypothetical protein
VGTKPVIIRPCTCNRLNRDLDNLAIIREQFHKSDKGHPSTYSLVVCLRDGCLGMYRSADKYVDSLPKIWHRDYTSLKGLDLKKNK